MSYQKRAGISDQNNVLSAVGRQDRKTEHVLSVVVGQALRIEHCLVSRGAGSENRTMSCQQWGSKLGEQTVTSCEGVQRKTMTVQVVSLTLLSLHRVTLEEDLPDTRAELTAMMM